MKKPSVKVQDLNIESSASKRRGFFKQLAGLLIGLTLWPTIKNHFGADTAIARTHRNLANSSRRYPAPTYLPKNYVFEGQYTDRPDGFKGGVTELVLWYRNKKHPSGLVNPLSVFMAPSPKHTELALTDERSGTLVQLEMGSEEPVNAIYHDGMWGIDREGERVLPNGRRISWKTSNVHSITFRLKDLTIGVRGCRDAGVNYDELLRVASSLR